MAEPKAKTLQQKLGFFDEDLKKPLHDDILKWVDINAEKLINSIYNFTDWNPSKISQLKKYSIEIVEKNKISLEKKIESLINEINSINIRIDELNLKLDSEKSNFNIEQKNLLSEKKIKLEAKLKELQLDRVKLDSCWHLEELPKREKIKIIEKIWEFPVTTQASSRTGYISSKSIVGFVDLMIRFSYKQLTLRGIDFENQIVEGTVEWAQTDQEINYRGGCSLGPLEHSIHIEVKTVIPSLGELFRQLRMYKEYITGDFIIVCPDDSERQLIVEQGFRFIKYVRN